MILDKKHEMQRKLFRQFAETEFTKEIQDELDETGEFNWDMHKKMARYGFMGVKIPKEYGGAGCDSLTYALMVEELARVDAVLSIYANTSNSLGGGPLLLGGSEAQKQKYLPAVASGEKIMVFGLTEPGAGSDAGGTTTTAIADSHEIANVAGLDGLRFMIEDGRRAPISIKYMMPSCVPALPDEQAGAVITAADMQEFFAEYPGDVFGLGEMMNLPGVFMADPETCARIDAANQTPSKQVDGHAPLVAGKDLNAYAAAGIIADHESTIPEEALDKLSRGMYVMLREVTCSHDLANLSPMLLENPARARRCCFATDDRAPSDALSTGMIDNACRVAIEAGVDPVVAISMASLSTAEAIGLDHGCRDPHELRGAIAPGKRADLLVLNDLTFATAPHRVYAAGALVAQDGTFVGEIAPEMAEVTALADELRASVKLPKLSLDVFDYAFKPGEAVIDVVPGKAITGMARPESAEGLRRIMLIERHGRGVSLQAEGADGDGPAGMGLVGKHIGRGSYSAGARRPDERRHCRRRRGAARRLYGQGARHGY